MNRLSGARPGQLPGFPLSLGITLLGIAGVVLLPLAALGLFLSRQAPGTLLASVSSPRVLAAARLSFLAALAGAVAASIAGLLLAWVLVRVDFPGHRLVDALIDLPFALPTAVAGISLTTLYAPSGWLGRPLAAVGIPVAFTPLGIVVALVFVGIPFSVRTLQPVLGALDPEVEEAAAGLGASPLRVFARVVFPEILPAWLTGFTLAFARSLGEYGSIVFISGNMPGRTEIAPLLVLTKLEQYDYAGASALATGLLAASFLLLLALNRIQSRAASGRTAA